MKAGLPLRFVNATVMAAVVVACGTRSHIVARNPALALAPTCAVREACKGD